MPHNPHPLASLSQLMLTTSEQDGVPPDLEDDLRVAGCMLIQEAGAMMKMPQSTIATAQVLFQRFFFVSSMLKFGVNDISISALYLAAKLDETPIVLKNIINTYIYLIARVDYLLSLSPSAPLTALLASTTQPSLTQEGDVWEGFHFEPHSLHSPIFWEVKEVLQYNESQILKRLGFNMQVDLPYAHVVNYLQTMDLVFDRGLAQLCWSILNDALLTRLYVEQPTHVLAVSSILLATHLRHIPVPEGWYLLFDVEWEDIWPVCGVIMRLWRKWGIRAVVDEAGEHSRATGDTNNTAADDNPTVNNDGVDPRLRQAVNAKKQKVREARWRHAWKLAKDRAEVIKWLEERGAEGNCS